MKNTSEYPRMLYKADAINQEVKGFLTNNKRIGYITVQSSTEELNAKIKGWVNTPYEAVKELERIDNVAKIKLFFLSHWEFWIRLIIAIIGLYITYLVIIK